MSDLGKTKAALAYLMDQLVYSDSYGVHGSEFAACRLCNGGGAPGVPLVHEKSCPMACYGDVAQEWWDEREDERKEAADEIASLRAQKAATEALFIEVRDKHEACKAQLASARKALQSVSTQCGNVIYNCEQRPADNERHLRSWRGVKDFADAALTDEQGR